MENNLTVAQPQSNSLAVFGSAQNFAEAQRMATALAHSSLVPSTYQNNVPNCLLALELSNRMGASPFMVMQNLDIIEGRPSFNSKFAIATANSSGRFSPIRWRVRDIGPKEVERTYWVGPKDKREKKTERLTIQDKGWTAYATDLATGEILEGPEVTLSMAFAEGWYTKNGSKWPTMPDVMGKYRSAKFFVNMYAPETLMGFPTTDELEDIQRTEDADWTDVTNASAPAAPVATSAEVINARAATRKGKTPATEKEAGPVVVTAEEVGEEKQTVKSQAAQSTGGSEGTILAPTGGDDSPGEPNGGENKDDDWFV